MSCLQSGSPISILPSSSTLSPSTTSVCKLSRVSDAYIYTLKNIVLLPREPQAPQMLHFNLTMDAASVLNCSPIDHRCSFTNCGKVICLRNRNHRHDLCSPSQQPHIISLSKSSTPRETDFARRQIFIIHMYITTPLHIHENPPTRPSLGTPDVGTRGDYPSQPTEQLSSLVETHLEMPQTTTRIHCLTSCRVSGT